jgi:hypothetical protein
MTEVQGFHVNTAIQAMVRDQLDEINSQFVRLALSLSDGGLEEYKIYPDQQSFRRAIGTIGRRKRSKKSKKPVDLVEVFPVLANAPAAADAVWGILSRRSSKALQLSEELQDADIFAIEAWSHRRRNQLSFINAFTRLLMVKEPINANRSDLEAYSHLMALVEASQYLNSKVIDSPLELEKWFEDVKEAFNKFSVVKDDAPRDFGQVRRGSQRIYLNAWKQFTEAEFEQIWVRSAEISKDPNNKEFLRLRARNSASYWPSFVPSSNFKYAIAEIKSEFTQGFDQQASSPHSITVDLKSIDLAGIGASRTFVSTDAANTGLESWILDLQDLFGTQKTQWSMVLSLQVEGAKNEISVSAPTVRKLLPQALAAIKVIADN